MNSFIGPKDRPLIAETDAFGADVMNPSMGPGRPSIAPGCETDHAGMPGADGGEKPGQGLDGVVCLSADLEDFPFIGRAAVGAPDSFDLLGLRVTRASMLARARMRPPRTDPSFPESGAMRRVSISLPRC